MGANGACFDDREATVAVHYCLPVGGVAGWWFGAVKLTSLRA